MRAMQAGTIPVVTGVGGLRDTVIDADVAPSAGTGFVAGRATQAWVGDAFRRARRAWADPLRRISIQQRGMAQDWSWHEPAAAMLRCYDRVLGAPGCAAGHPQPEVIDLTATAAPGERLISVCAERHRDAGVVGETR
jgi:starch synthase